MKPPFVPDVCILLRIPSPYLTHSCFDKSKKANFDASHELEELLLEDNPLKAKQRKANQDNLSAEMRQMEEQYVAPLLWDCFFLICRRFTPYDFKKMHRRSYYPHNQHIVSTVTASESTGALVASRPATPATTDQRSDRATVRQNGHAAFDSADSPMREKVMSEKEHF
jgi:serine/threonine kinase 32